MVSPTTWTRLSFRRSRQSLNELNVNFSDSMNVSSFSSLILGGARSMSFDEEYTMSPGVKMIWPPYACRASTSSWVFAGRPLAVYS